MTLKGYCQSGKSDIGQNKLGKHSGFSAMGTMGEWLLGMSGQDLLGKKKRMGKKDFVVQTSQGEMRFS